MSHEPRVSDTQGEARLQELMSRLPKKARVGSKPRCHLLTHGSPAEVASRLSELVVGWGRVSEQDHWMPQGFEQVEEAQLGAAGLLIPDEAKRRALLDWWLAAPRGARTPNWDIASTCTLSGHKEGIVLIEAKAHDAELRIAEAGKCLGQGVDGVSMNSRRNHVRIGACIDEANLALSKATKLPWALSRDWCYQISNRFDWAWKLASLGTPVILVYLGFLGCREMEIKDQRPFESPQQWEQLVKDHSMGMIPPSVWGTTIRVGKAALIPLSRSRNQPLELPA